VKESDNSVANIRLKTVDVPPAVKIIPLGAKQKRGRPSKAKKALII